MNLLNIPYIDELIALRRDIHAHPETGFHEIRTAGIIAEALERYGLAVYQGLNKTGVVGVLKAGSGERMIGLRADIDALPLTEANTFSHRSRHTERMHACGHDGHTTMLLGAARYLSEHPDFDGAVAFIFQPAEESEGGAAGMIEDGLFQKFPISSVYGLHNWPDLPVGEMAVVAGPVMAGVSRFEITIQGRGGHAAMPHLANDVIVASSQMVTALQTITSRCLSPSDPAVVSVTQINAGNVWNILPEKASLRGTMRFLRPEIQEKIETSMTRLVSGIAAAHDVRADVKFIYVNPPTINTATEADICLSVARGILGEDKVRNNMSPSMAAEDFSYMLGRCPGCYVWLGNGTGVLHSARYDFNDAILSMGVSYWVKLTQTLLPPGAD